MRWLSVRRRSTVVVGLVIAGCTSACASHQPLPLPCGIAQLKWQMSERELQQLRPTVRWDSSMEVYWEHIETCQPFFETAAYKFTRWHGLTAVHLSRVREIESPGDLEATIPGFLYSCRSLWGDPGGVEVFTRPKTTLGQYWNVGLWWTPSWGEIYAFYTSPQALRPIGSNWSTGYYVEFAPHCIADWREWSRGETSSEMLAKYFGGFPSGKKVPRERFE